tara:strand:- start:374 stop:979 length:606 start_codon:yes stop_codon:yes gene_type:complete
MGYELRRLRHLLCLLIVTTIFSVSADDDVVFESHKKSSEYKTIEWDDLIPEEDLQILLNPPSFITDIEDGSSEDDFGELLSSASDDPDLARYQKALVSKDVKPGMNGMLIRLPGFVVPLEFDGQQVITQFFLVPYFGACLHMPPPPPNQIVFVRYPKGLKLEALNYPVWLSGKLETAITESDMATAVYAMDMDSFEYYVSE